MTTLVVIPARYGSVRFPGKPLALLQGKPMIQHVYERAAKAHGVDAVVVATDDQRIVEAVHQVGGEAVMTSLAARSGTERAAEVARTRTAQIIINVQGDEPLVHPDMVGQLVDCLQRHQAVVMASLMTPLRHAEDAANPNVVKVVTDRDGFALYFSRSPIPFARENQDRSRFKVQGSGAGQLPSASNLEPRTYFKHLGIYGYQRHFLLQFPHLEPTPLERAEQLEQLRALEHGHRIKLLETPHDTIGVDTPADLQHAETVLAASSASAAPRPTTLPRSQERHAINHQGRLS